jgi:hypothetical protein
MTTKWSLIDATQAAYAEVKNTDGSISYLYMPRNSGAWLTSAWLGTGQPLIYHAVNYGMSPTNTAAINTAALQAALTAAFSGGGGIVFIPPGVYQVSGTISLTFGGVPGNDHGIIIDGGGGDTELVQNNFVDLFSFTGLASGRGVRLRDLRITFAASGAATLPPAAVRTANCESITCERVYFRNFPASLVDDNMSVQCGLFDCTIDYTGSSLADQTMVTLTGSEDFIDHCIFKQLPISQGGPTGCVGLSIGSASTVYITNTHISDFDYGIEIPGGGVNLQHALFSGINCQSNVTGLTIKPASNGTIYELFFVNCVFARTGDSTSVSPGILIDTDGGVSTNVSDICFANCMSHDWAGPGMQINAGQDIVVTGGRYGMDATDNSMTTSGAIAVTGPAVRVSVLGADCSGKIPTYNSQPPASNQQPYGISVTGAVVDMQVRGCDLTNCKTGALYAVAGSDLRVTDCDGYNDQGTILQSTIPPPANQTNEGGRGNTPRSRT